MQADEQIVGTSGVCDLQRRVRDLERLLGRKSMEVKIHKEASVSQAREIDLAAHLLRRAGERIAVIAFANTLGVASDTALPR